MLHAIVWAVACTAAGYAARALTTRLLHLVFGRVAKEGPGRHTWTLTVGSWQLTVSLQRKGKP